jgi:hypothetical protein
MKGKVYKMFVVKRIEDVFLKTKKTKGEKKRVNSNVYLQNKRKSKHFFLFQMKRSQSARPSSKKRTGKKNAEMNSFYLSLFQYRY